MTTPDTYPSRIKNLRDRDLVRLSRLMIWFVAVPLMLIGINLDVSLYGFNQNWTVARAGIIVAALLGSAATRVPKLGHLVWLPAVTVVAYVVAVFYYLIAATGMERSFYVNVFPQVILGIAVLPMARLVFLSVVCAIWAGYGAEILVFQTTPFDQDGLPSIFLSLNNTLIAVLIYFIVNQIRDAFYKKTLDQEDELVNRDGIIRKQVEALVRSREEAIALELQASLGKIAAQAAHDIRSPLAALSNVRGSLDHLDEDTRALLKAGIGRIEQIAQSLLHQHRRGGVSGAGSFGTEQRNEVRLEPLIAAMIAEKQLEYKSRPDVRFQFVAQPESSRACAQLAPGQLLRVLSNLINNGVEALDRAGNITLGVSVDPDNLCVSVSIQDDGKGVSPDLLSVLGRERISHGKAAGNGMGLVHARETVETMGGRMKIDSTLGQGTTVTLTFPLADY